MSNTPLLNQAPLPDDELAALQLLAIHNVATQDRPAPFVAEALPADPRKAYEALRGVESEMAQLNPYKGQLLELVRLLEQKQPDILAEISQQRTRPGFWTRLKRTLGLD